MNDKLEALLRQAVKRVGSFHPRDVLPVIEEQLTFAELRKVDAFLLWLCDNGRTFGWNLPEVYAEYQRTR